MERPVDVLLDMLDLVYFELGEAFTGLADENVWKRPAPGLLSVGELAGHIAYWEAVRFAGKPGEPIPDPAECIIKSPLIDRQFAYYTHTLPRTSAGEALSLSAKQVHEELLRVHKEAMAHFKSLDADIDVATPGFPGPNTYREALKYTAFHVGYHTGQMYSARHLLGEQTPDN